MKEEEIIENNFYSDKAIEKIKYSGLPEDKQKLYMDYLMSEDKIMLLAELWEHYGLYPHFMFDVFESFSEEELKDTQFWIKMQIDGYMEYDELLHKINNLSEKQRKKWNNLKLLEAAVIRNLDDKLLPYLQSVHFRVLDEMDIENDKIFMSFDAPIRYEELLDYIEDLRNQELPIISAMRGFWIDYQFCDEYGSHENSICVDFKYQQIMCKESRESIEKILENINQDYMPKEMLRHYYEQIQDIKLNIMQNESEGICQMVEFIESVKIRDVNELRNEILNQEELNEYTQHISKNGVRELKMFLENYDSEHVHDFYYLNESNHLERLDKELALILMDDASSCISFDRVMGYEQTKDYLSDLLPNETEELIKKCQENLWLKKGGIPFEDDDLSEEEYGYHFRRCERRMDLMNAISDVSWAIRDGFVYKNMAFIQQVNGGDEYWTLIHDGDKWIDYESVTFRPSIENDRFYTLVDELKKEGQKAIERERSRKDRNRGERL